MIHCLLLVSFVVFFPPGKGTCRRTESETSPGCAAQFLRQHASDPVHCVDGFIQRDEVFIPSQNQVRAEKRLGGEGRVPAVAGDFHHTLDEIAHRSHDVLEHRGGGVAGLPGRPSRGVRHGRRRHGSRRTDLHLASRHFRGKGASEVVKVSNGSRSPQGGKKAFPGDAEIFLEGGRHSGEDTGGAAGGSCADHAAGRADVESGHGPYGRPGVRASGEQGALLFRIPDSFRHGGEQFHGGEIPRQPPVDRSEHDVKTETHLLHEILFRHLQERCLRCKGSAAERPFFVRRKGEKSRNV